MPRGKPEQAEQIIPKLQEVEVELGRVKTVAEAVEGAREGELSAQAATGGTPSAESGVFRMMSHVW